MSGKLIVIEGVDGSGKATQTAKLYEALQTEGYTVGQMSFPNYGSPSSGLIKMYLNGEFGKNADDVNAFAASTFYAVDRFATFRKDWAAFYQKGGILLADRYTTSNMVHQGSKIDDAAARKVYLDWLLDLEYRLLELPKPELVIFLDMPPEVSAKLRAERNGLKKDLKQDIHEADESHLQKAYHNARMIAQNYGWAVISCVDSAGTLRSIAAIHEEILRIVRPLL